MGGPCFPSAPQKPHHTISNPGQSKNPKDSSPAPFLMKWVSFQPPFPPFFLQYDTVSQNNSTNSTISTGIHVGK